MINIIQSEYIKYKRTFTRKLIIIMPLFAIMMALLTPLQFFINQVYNLWAIIFIPIGIALQGTLAVMQEKKAGNCRNLLVHNISPARLWIGKIIVMSIHVLLSILVLTVESIVVFHIVSKEIIPWGRILESAGIMWLTSIVIIPLQLWVATWKGIFASMMFGFLGLGFGLFAVAKSYWIYIPWSYAARLMCPILGVGPNGVALEVGDSLLNPYVIPVGLMVSIIALVVFTISTALWFNKKEVS